VGSAGKIDGCGVQLSTPDTVKNNPHFFSFFPPPLLLSFGVVLSLYAVRFARQPALRRSQDEEEEVRMCFLVLS
jgi:hypothetical protein